MQGRVHLGFAQIGGKIGTIDNFNRNIRVLCGVDEIAHAPVNVINRDVQAFETFLARWRKRELEARWFKGPLYPVLVERRNRPAGLNQIDLVLHSRLPDFERVKNNDVRGCQRIRFLECG